MRGVILAAGKGARLNGTAGDKPKCLVELGGITLVERQIRTLEHAGIEDIVIVVGSQADRVRKGLWLENHVRRKCPFLGNQQSLFALDGTSSAISGLRGTEL